MLVKDFKTKLVLITGVEVDDMNLELYLGDRLQRKLTAEDDQQTLAQLIGDQKPSDVQVRFHVTDQSGQSAQLVDEQSAPKYEMSDVDYDKRADSLRNFKKDNKLGRFGSDVQQ